MGIILISLSVMIVLGTVLLFFINQRYFLYSLFVSYPIIAQCVDVNLDLPGLSINMSQLYGFVVFMLIVVAFLIRMRMNGLFLVSLITVAYCFCTAAFLLSPSATVIASMKFGCWMLLIPLSSALIEKEDEFKIISDFAYITVIIIFLSMILSRLGVYGHSTNYGRYGQDLEVAVGAFFNQSGIAAAFALAIPMLLVKWLTGTKKLRYQLGVLIAFLGILMTYVRGPLIAVGLSYLYLFSLSLRHGMKRISLHVLLVIAAGVMVISVFYLLNPDTAFIRWQLEQELVREGRIEKLGSGRVWDLMYFTGYFAERMSLFQKVFGIGFGTDGMINPTHKLAHNTFLGMLVGSGLFGLAIFTTFLGIVFKRFKRALHLGSGQQRRIVCLLGLMLLADLTLLLLRGVGAMTFPYFMSSIFLGGSIGFLSQGESEREPARQDIGYCRTG